MNMDFMAFLEELAKKKNNPFMRAQQEEQRMQQAGGGAIKPPGNLQDERMMAQAGKAGGALQDLLAQSRPQDNSLPPGEQPPPGSSGLPPLPGMEQYGAPVGSGSMGQMGGQHMPAWMRYARGYR